MEHKKKIEKRLESDLGFENCKVSKPQAKTQGEFEAECKNSYKDTFTCQGKISKEGILSKTDCEKKE